MPELKCFIACAFGKEDVEEIYNNGILPALKELNITPLRVDKVEHNENIDQKIIELISKADFCICDLTYSRPSVYYEAGYAHGMNKQVIFCVRKDHFIPKDADINGITRVHFDLQMKNIIDWTSTVNTVTFQKRMISRIKLITKPLINKLIENEQKEQNRDVFRHASLNMRISLLNDESKDVVRELQYQAYNSKNEKVDFENQNIDFYIKQKKVIKIAIQSTLTIKSLKEEWKRFINLAMRNYEKGYSFHLVVVTLRKLPEQRIEEAYPDALTEIPGKRIQRPVALDKHIYMHFIGNIQSVSEYTIEIENILNDIDKRIFA